MFVGIDLHKRYAYLVVLNTSGEVLDERRLTNQEVTGYVAGLAGPVHVNVTHHPTDAWVAQQLREATPCGEGPRFLIRDNDKKYGEQFQHVMDGRILTS